MTLEQLCKLIPAEFRKEILECNMIASAVAQAENPAMHYLSEIWKAYIEPAFDSSCGRCLNRALKEWRKMQPALVELEKREKLLNEA